MTTSPKNNGRNSAGRFTKGNKLGGKKIGSRHRVTLAIEALFESEHERLSRKAVDLALEGDTTALRLCMERLVPPRKDRPISIRLPEVRSAKGSLEASNGVLTAVFLGEITPDEGTRIIALLDAHRRLIEVADLETRIERLEGRGANEAAGR